MHVHLKLFYGSLRYKVNPCISISLLVCACVRAHACVCVCVCACVVNAIESVTALQAVKRAVAMVTDGDVLQKCPSQSGYKV